MIWYDKIWYDRIWCDVIWYDMMWYDVMWYDKIWCDMIWDHPSPGTLHTFALYQLFSSILFYFLISVLSSLFSLLMHIFYLSTLESTRKYSPGGGSHTQSTEKEIQIDVNLETDKPSPIGRGAFKVFIYFIRALYTFYDFFFFFSRLPIISVIRRPCHTSPYLHKIYLLYLALSHVTLCNLTTLPCLT